MSFASARKKAITETIKQLQATISPDQLIIASARTIQDIDVINNKLAKRLRYWYEFYAPEISYGMEDHVAFARKVLSADKNTLLKEFGVDKSVGGDIPKNYQQPMMDLATQVVALDDQRQQLVSYIEEVMKDHMPNLLAICSGTIAGKLLEHAGSLVALARMPSSTIQVLGAEKALFKHLLQRKKPPKHGILYAHQLVARSKRKGHTARQLANAIALCARCDAYGDNHDLGKQLKEELSHDS